MVLGRLRHRPLTSAKSAKIASTAGASEKKLGIAVPMSSAKARMEMSGKSLASLRSSRSTVAANSSGDNGQPWRMPEVISKPSKTPPLHATSHLLPLYRALMN